MTIVKLQSCFLAVCLSVMFYHCVAGQTVIDFDELMPPDQGNDQQYFDGYGPDATNGSWTSGGVEFNTNLFGPGWSYSNVDDVDTPGFENQWAAITGLDFGGDGIYAMATSFFPDGAFFNIPVESTVASIWVTNATYSYHSMLQGDCFAKQFGGLDGTDPDFFKVVFRGYSQPGGMGEVTGETEFYLADFRFDDNRLDYLVDNWQPLDLARLGNARSVGISFASSDVGKFGINTPVYVALDELTLNTKVLLGDVNQDGVISLLDVQPFVLLVTDSEFQIEADINRDGFVDLLDVQPFVELLTE